MKHPIYECKRIDRNLHVTGKIDDPLWHDAVEVDLTDPITGERLPKRCTARLLYSSKYLYLAFCCEADYIKATLTAHDSPVWTEGCMELFISPSNTMRAYYEINVNPLNTVFDTFLLNGRQIGDKSWNILTFVDYTCKDLVTMTSVEGELNVVGAGKGWKAEYALPFSSLIGHDNIVPVAGDEWRMNLCHIDSPYPGQEDAQHYSWSTIGDIDFHAPWAFGTLRFV